MSFVKNTNSPPPSFVTPGPDGTQPLADKPPAKEPSYGTFPSPADGVAPPRTIQQPTGKPLAKEPSYGTFPSPANGVAPPLTPLVSPTSVGPTVAHPLAPPLSVGVLGLPSDHKLCEQSNDIRNIHNRLGDKQGAQHQAVKVYEQRADAFKPVESSALPESVRLFRHEVEAVLQSSKLEFVPMNGGTSGVYVIEGPDGQHYVLKPDSQAGCAPENPKGYAYFGSLDEETARIRSSIPLGDNAKRSAAAYALASTLGMNETSVSVVMVSIDASRIPGCTGDGKRLCSVQKFMKGQDLNAYAAEHIQQEGQSPQSDEELDACFTQVINDLPQSQLQDISVMNWLIGECDSHAENLMVYLRNGSPQLCSLDHDLSFSENSRDLRNVLTRHGRYGLLDKTLSEDVIEKIKAMDVHQGVDVLRAHGLSGAAIDNFAVRLLVLKQLVEIAPPLSLGELHDRMVGIGGTSVADEFVNYARQPSAEGKDWKNPKFCQNFIEFWANTAMIGTLILFNKPLSGDERRCLFDEGKGIS